MEASFKQKSGKINEPSVESPYTSLGSDGSYNVLIPSTTPIKTYNHHSDSNNSTLTPPLTAEDITVAPHLSRTDITVGAPPLHTSSLLMGAHRVNDTTAMPHHNYTGNSTTYLSLRAKAEKGHVKFESRTKAVMDALQGLQSKIRKIESDRSSAEMNLKCLALETKDYKELIKLKEKLGGNMDAVLKESQSKVGEQWTL